MLLSQKLCKREILVWGDLGALATTAERLDSLSDGTHAHLLSQLGTVGVDLTAVCTSPRLHFSLSRCFSHSISCSGCKVCCTPIIVVFFFPPQQYWGLNSGSYAC
jgi:hypothetical protein